MNDHPTSQMMLNQPPIMNQAAPPPPQNFQVLTQPQPQPQLPVQSQPMIMNRSYNTTNANNNMVPWSLPQNPSGKFGNFVPSKKPRSNNNSNNNNNNWKGKKVYDKRRMDKQLPPMSAGQGSNQGYNPPTLHELQSQNRQKTRKFYPNKKKFNNRFAPYAPRNTTSFIIRAKKSGGIASLVSPCPVTPAVLPTPIFSPSREVLGDMAKEEWGVDGYGTMKGLIRLRSENEHDEEDDDEGSGSSESDVEEHVEVERRLDHDLSRFEMIYPNHGNECGGNNTYNNVLENRVDDQDTHIAQLEEENLTLKERLFLMERELDDLRKRMQSLESQNNNYSNVNDNNNNNNKVEDVNEEVVENGSENESENGSDIRENIVGLKKEENNEDVCMEENVHDEVKKVEEDGVVRDDNVRESVIGKKEDQRKIEDVEKEIIAIDRSETEDKAEKVSEEIKVAEERVECVEKEEVEHSKVN